MNCYYLPTQSISELFLRLGIGEKKGNIEPGHCVGQTRNYIITTALGMSQDAFIRLLQQINRQKL
jgi:hypothetical protein